MSWFSFLRKKTQEPAPGESEFYSHAENLSAGTRSRGRGKNNEPAADPMLPEKKRARRRLIGAIALTLGLAIVLPMVFDAEPQPISQDIVIHIPSRDKGPSLSAPGASAPAAEKQAEAASPDKPASPQASTPVMSSSPPTPPPAAAHASAPEKIKSAEKPPAPVKAPSAAADKGDVDEIGEIVKAANAQQGKVMIQVAALASQEKVDELRARLAKAGIDSQTQKVPTKDGERIRVRVGPFASKEEAEKTCLKLAKMNLKCTILSK